MYSILYNIFTMNLSRTHIAFLAIISIFTGLIGPGTHTGDRLLSYLMTDIRMPTYIILAILIIAFYSAATRSWRWFRICSVIVFIGIGTLLFSTILGKIHTINNFSVTFGLSWGWIFLFIGCLLLVWAYGQREYGDENNSFSETIDSIIGILWWFTLACIVWGIILSSVSLFSHSQKPSILLEMFGSWNIHTLSWGIHVSWIYESIVSFSYDRKWDILSLTSKTGTSSLTQILSAKNMSYSGWNSFTGILTEKIEEKWNFYEVWKAWKSGNKLHSMSGVEDNGKKRIVFDGEILWRELEEIREVFVWDDGSYAYFGRPLGEEKYCLFTRYKGNKCGLSGYMNPQVWADGDSILYAGYTDNIWSIYRNGDIIIKNTWYTTQDNTNDYVFFDITNPRTFLFIKKDIKTGKYLYIKNGVVLPWIWNDVGTKVDFWFDNHIITTAKDEKWWRLIEL